MIGLDVEVKGVKQIRPSRIGAIRAVIRPIVEKIRQLVIARTPVDKGTAKAGWSELYTAPEGLSFTNPVAYMHVLEEGLYPGVGPKTVAYAGGIYSSQAPGGMITPIMEDKALIDGMADEIADKLIRLLA